MFYNTLNFIVTHSNFLSDEGTHMFFRIPQMSLLNTQGQIAVPSSLLGTLGNQGEEWSEDSAGAWGCLSTISPRGNIGGPCWMVVSVA